MRRTAKRIQRLRDRYAGAVRELQTAQRQLKAAQDAGDVSRRTRAWWAAFEAQTRADRLELELSRYEGVNHDDINL